jgi:hypothetical protein
VKKLLCLSSCGPRRGSYGLGGGCRPGHDDKSGLSPACLTRGDFRPGECLLFAVRPSLTLIGEMASVSVEQASGKSIAHGSGSIFGSLNSALPFPCDGAAHTVSVNVLADPSGPPFHGGPAVFSAFAHAQAGTPCYPGSTNCFFIVADEGGNVGPTSLTMH